jgi:hypothetical protein
MLLEKEKYYNNRIPRAAFACINAIMILDHLILPWDQNA